MQRLRIKFRRGAEIKFISHLDIVRLWLRAFNRAGIEIAYSAGFSPHPRISLAAPLPIGVTSEAELMDIFIIKGVAPQFFVSAINQQLPPGMMVDKVYPISYDLPSLQSIVSLAEYKVEVDMESAPRDMQTALDALLKLEHLPWQHQRDTGPHQYDLRTLIDGLWIIGWNLPSGYPLGALPAGGHPLGVLGMRLRCDSSGSGRPEQVAAALGCTRRPEAIHRTQLILKGK